MNPRLPPSSSRSPGSSRRSRSIPGWLAWPAAVVGLLAGAAIAVFVFGLVLAVVLCAALVGLGAIAWMRLRGKTPADVLSASLRRAATQAQDRQRARSGPVVDIDAREVDEREARAATPADPPRTGPRH